LLDPLNEPGVEVVIPEAVLIEMSSQDQDDPAAVAARSTDWIQVVPTPPTPEADRARRLGARETSMLALAVTEMETATTDEVAIEIVLFDGKARRFAESLGLRVQGTLAFLLIGKRTGRIDAVRPLLEQLHSGGVDLSDEVMRRVLAQAGEWRAGRNRALSGREGGTAKTWHFAYAQAILGDPSSHWSGTSGRNPSRSKRRRSA
jgi:predicted nucleic acid-binding protein